MNLPPSSSSTPRRLWCRRALALAGLALLTGSMFLTGTSRAGIPAADGPPAPLGPSAPPHAPPSPQDCLDDFLANSQRCHDIWCSPASFLWFDWMDCNTTQLANCMDKVNHTYECCMAPDLCDSPTPQPGVGP